jgi:hypothetical protein
MHPTSGMSEQSSGKTMCISRKVEEPPVVDIARVP